MRIGWQHFPESSQSLAQRMVGLLTDRDHARMIGQAYLSSRGADASIKNLTLKLAGTSTTYARLLSASDPKLRGFLAARCRREFGSGRTISIDGWVLSESEANLCALTVLLANIPADLSIRAPKHA